MIHFLDGQTDKLLGYLDGSENKNFYADEIEQTVTGENRFTFKTKASQPEAAGLEDRQRVLVPHERSGLQEFICYNALGGRKEKTLITIGSEVDLDKLKTVPAGTYTNMTLRQFLELATDGIEWKVGDVVGGQLGDITLDNMVGGFEFIKRVQNEFNVETSYRIEAEGSEVLGRYVDAFTRLGEVTGKEFVNTKDIIDIQKEVFTDRYITALWVIGPDDAEGNKRPPILVTNKDAFERWNRKGQHLYGIHVVDSDDTEITNAKLTALGQNELEKRIASVVQYTVDAVDLAPHLPHEAAFLGDTVGIIDEEFNPPLYASARIIAVKRPVQRPDMEFPVRKRFVIGEVLEYKKVDMAKTLAEMRLDFKMIVSNAERLALEAMLAAEGVVDSERLKQLLDEKANADALGDLVTNDQLAAVDEAVAGKILDAINNIDLTDFAKNEDVDDRVEEVKEQVKDVNAYNLIRNSAGYAGMDYWYYLTSNEAGVTTIMNDELERLKYGAAFHFPAAPVNPTNRGIGQIINVEPGKEMTIAWVAEKSVAGAVTIQILEDNVVKLTVPDFSDPTYPFRSSYVPYTPTSGQIAIQVLVSPAAEYTITGFMAAPGNLPTQWTLANGELYNAYVRIDERGLSVYRLDENGQVEGYSVVSPEEFAIYYDENKNGDIERVFWFNRDETVTKKLRVLEEISFPTTKAVYIDTPASRGIAFVKRASDI